MPHIDRNDEHATRSEDLACVNNAPKVIDPDAWKKLSPCELMAGNVQLAQWAAHWETRAETAEKRLAAIDKAERPEEPAVIKDLRAGMTMHHNPNFSSKDGRTVTTHIDALTAYASRMQADKERAESALATVKVGLLSRKANDTFTEFFAKHLHYLENIAVINDLKTAADVTEAIEGGRARFMNNPIFRAKVNSIVAAHNAVIDELLRQIGGE